jgi:deoxyribodipyrimidine photo-lyase
LHILKWRGARILVNQNGVFYPEWCERVGLDDWQLKNQFLKRLNDSADYVFFQSQYALESYRIWVGSENPNYKVLINPVDLSVFRPAKIKLMTKDLRVLIFLDVNSFTSVFWKEVKEKIVCNEKIHGVGGFSPGEQEAKKMLEYFLEHKCKGYEHDRNDFTKDGQSNLSPYISHGNLSRRRILLELCKKEKCTPEELFSPRANGSNGAMGSVASFVEECFVRAELAENFCYYNENYDRVEGFKPWAQETLRARRQDTRAYCYAREVFEEARTHDLLWNSAQRELILTGKMHGYLRMYWAKKILEWSKDEHEALRVANYLNDTYELDGRDPNGYVGCAWSIGGVHDRPWFPRPIFGTIRYMAESGVKKRGDIQLYCDTYRDSDIDKQQSLLYTIPN